MGIRTISTESGLSCHFFKFNTMLLFLEADETVVDFPAAKKVRFEPKTKSKPEMNDLRKRQKAHKDKLKRKDKFETKLSDHFEKAFEGL